MKLHNENNDQIDNQIYSIYADPNAYSEGIITSLIGTALAFAFYPFYNRVVEKLD
ncbi:MAG: hypothetical protein GY874_21890 [Desulfobacteraceae bacterium]|nr:hypothetical protein [Desulfobacteraceae bacterium]